jgi:hypothetical protein
MSYQIISRNPLQIQGCTPGTGAICGVAALRKNFENLLQKTLTNVTINPRSLPEALKTFDRFLMTEFNPLSEDCDKQYEVPLPGVWDVPSIGLENGYLIISKYVTLLCMLTLLRERLAIDVFEPVFEKILALVQNQIEHNGEQTKV